MSQPDMRVTKRPDQSAEARARRAKNARRAEANLRLEGMILDDEEKALQRRWIDGEITSDEWREAIYERHGLAKPE